MESWKTADRHRRFVVKPSAFAIACPSAQRAARQSSNHGVNRHSLKTLPDDEKKIVPEICPPMVRLAWVQLELAPACRSLLLGQSLRLGEERLAGGTDGFAGDMSVRRDAEFSSGCAFGTERGGCGRLCAALRLACFCESVSVFSLFSLSSLVRFCGLDPVC